jgi:hypothetical protein
MYGTICQAGEYVGQVLANRDAQLAAAFDDGQDGRDFGSSLFASQVQPVPPSNGDSPDILPMSVRN